MALVTRTILAASGLAAAFVSTSANAASDPRGVWMSDSGRGAIEITDCNGGLCGYVVWVKEGSDAFGCGKKIIDTVKSSGDGVWDGGRIYNPDRKKWYDVDIKRLDNERLKVTGHKLFFSKTMTWTLAPADLVRCNAVKDEAAASAAPTAKVAAAQTAAVPTAKVAAVAAPVPATATVKPAAAAKAVPVEQEVAQADPVEEESSENFDLEKGIAIGDTVNIKKLPSGKCAIDTPWINLKVNCNRKARSED